jgi:hypothetical protein
MWDRRAEAYDILMARASAIISASAEMSIAMERSESVESDPEVRSKQMRLGEAVEALPKRNLYWSDATVEAIEDFLKSVTPSSFTHDRDSIRSLTVAIGLAAHKLAVTARDEGRKHLGDLRPDHIA